MYGIEEETGVTTVFMSPWVYHFGYVRIGVCGCMWVVVLVVLAARSHMFLQCEQGGYQCCWIWYRLIRVWMAK